MGKPSQENFYKRLNQLAGTNKSTVNEQNNGSGTLIDYQRSDEGTVYGIVKENHRYFIKKSNTTNQNLDASDFAYIGGLENKHIHEYHSLGEAEKQRNMYIKSLNEAFSLKPKEVVNENEKVEERIDDPFNFLKSRISEGKEKNKKKFEDKFKSSLNEDVKEIQKKSGLMPESADLAIKKALGLIKEEDMVTADSEIKDKDKVSEKKGKEEAQAPINDKNAKAHAEKAMGHDSMEGKKNDSKSIAVNQADKVLKEEASPLVTDDSEIVSSQSLANMDSATKENPQAPINDTNAKAHADKAMGKGAGNDNIANNTEEKPESDPMDDKENAGDEKSDIVSEDDKKSDPFDENPHGGKKAMSTEDSDQKDADRVDNDTKKETPQAPYNSYNQPDKGHKEEKGEELKPKESKKDIVAEGDDLSTKDSHIKEKESVANKTDDPLKKHGKDLSTEDSEMNPNDSLANDTKTNLPNPVAEAAALVDKLMEGESLIYSDSPEDADESLANDTKTNLPNPVAEGKKEDMDGDGDIDSDDYMAKKDAAIKKSMNEDDEIESELDQAADALDSMEVEEPAPEVPAPEMGGEEAPMDDMGAPEGGEMPTADDPLAGADDAMGAPEMGGEEAPMDDMGAPDEVPAEGGQEKGEVADDETKNEIKSKFGEVGELARDKEFEDAEIVELVNQAIEPFDTEGLSHNDQLKIQNKVKGEEGTGEDLPPESPEAGEEQPPVEDIPVPEEGGEEPMGEAEEMCAECGTFEGYAKSRGYENLQECGGMELANLLSGYANAYNDGQNDGDFGKVIILMSPEVKDELSGYGHDDFIAKAEEMGGDVKDEEKLSPGAFDVEVPEVPEEEEEVEVAVDDAPNMEDDNSDSEENVDEAEQIDELGWRDIKNVGAGIGGLGKDAGSALGKAGQAVGKAVGSAVQRGAEKVKGAAQGVKQGYHKHQANAILNDISQDANKLVDTIIGFNQQAQKAGQKMIDPQVFMSDIKRALSSGQDINFAQRALEGEEEQPVMEFAPVAQNLGVGTHTGAMSEGEEKVRDYVKNRLAELAGKKKPSMNESEKPVALKKLDKMISEQWELYKKQVKNG